MGVKIFEGHSLKEWEDKYKAKFEKGKLKIFNSDKELIDFAKYWKINNKYYQVPSIFEWYNKSLRKSVGLTVALTGTSILATFFLVAALVQSQVKWNEDQGYTISFYAEEGTFDGGSKTRTISGIKKGTKFGDVRKSSKYKNPSKNDYEFKHWHVDDDKETPTEFPDDTKITSNVSLKAYYELNPRDPVLFGGPEAVPGVDCDSWETVLNVIEQGEDAFIDAYCTTSPTYTENLAEKEKRHQALLDFMDSTTNWRTISVGSINNYGVRLIGVGQDKLYQQPENDEERALFTFEFNECVTALPYSYIQGGTPFYTKEGSSDPEEKQKYCGLKTFTEDIIQPQLPQLIREHIQTVEKRTLQIKGGLKYKVNEELQSYQFKRDCLSGLEIVKTPETLFSLSLDEIGATQIPFEYTFKKETSPGVIETITRDGVELMKQTTHFDKTQWPEAVKGLTKGEGFLNEETNDYTDSYMFYSRKWESSEGHTDPDKRMKRYFIGEGEESINTQYRLRSIYIPNIHDVDDETAKKASGNKDYSCFETWNISENGDFGGYTVSGEMNTTEGRTDERWHFFRGDMAWASIFVAPAFCL